MAGLCCDAIRLRAVIWNGCRSRADRRGLLDVVIAGRSHLHGAEKVAGGLQVCDGLNHSPDIPLLPAAILARLEARLIESRSDRFQGFRPTRARDLQLAFELLIT